MTRIKIKGYFKDFTLWRKLSDFAENFNSNFILKNTFCSVRYATSGCNIAHFMEQKINTQKFYFLMRISTIYLHIASKIPHNLSQQVSLKHPYQISDEGWLQYLLICHHVFDSICCKAVDGRSLLYSRNFNVLHISPYNLTLHSLFLKWKVAWQST